MAKPSELWSTFLDGCLARRIQDDQFTTLVKQLYRRSPIIGIKLANILLEEQKSIPGVLDPLIPVYVELLLEHGRINSADLLGALYKHSKSSVKTPSQDEDTPVEPDDQAYNVLELESTVFDVVSRAYSPGGGKPASQDEARAALKLLAEWLNATVATGASLVEVVDPQVFVETISVYNSLGALSIAMLENIKVIGIVDTALQKDVRKRLAQGLTAFTAFWAQAAPHHAQNAARLDMAQKSRDLVDEVTSGTHEAALDVAAAVQVEAVVDLQILHTRPHVFVFISALLTGCPLTDESMMMNYLHVRYGGDAQSLAIDLITATFDVLAATAERNESKQVMFSLKCFLMNKIPTLLSTLTGSLLTPEFSINEALNHVDLTMFPVGLGMLQNNTAFQDTRQDFVYACILHGLLTSDSVGRLLGESTFDSPPLPERRYQKDNLFHLCSTEPGKAVQLINELEKLDGNAGAIVGAVTEVIRSSCAAKDTMSLKPICNALSSKPQVLDVMLQFISPASVLEPLCQLLDAWRYEDDQGEYQPVYDEFASVFLLVLAFAYRYGFSHMDLGITKVSFVARYLAQNHNACIESQLTEEQSRHLGSWIKGLFDPDGLTEEVYASCRPQQFYMLAPTIFSQTVLACSVGVLGIDVIKNGLEYLSEPFLLPSLVDAVYWLTTYVREHPGADVDIILQMLLRVTRAPAPGDAQTMHSTIMAIVALPLSNCLRTLRQSNPKRTEINTMLQSLKQYSDFRRSPHSPVQELKSWTDTAGGLKHAAQMTFQSLISWSLQVTHQFPAQLPPHYNQRLFLLSERVLGAQSLLAILLEEAKQQTDNPTGAAAVAIDIATAIICAPKSENSPIEVGWVTSPVPTHQAHDARRLNLRDALALEYERATEIMKNDQTMSETVVRLYRRVEAQAIIGVTPLPDMAVQMPAILPSLGLTASQSVVNVQQQMDFAQEATMEMDLGVGDPMSMDLTGGDDGMGMMDVTSGVNAEDDMFGDLDLSNMDDIGDMDYGF